MGLFGRKTLTCEAASDTIAEKCAASLLAIKNTMEVPANRADKTYGELYVLSVIAHRIAMQSVLQDNQQMQRTITLFDRYLGQRVNLAPLYDLLDRRGPEYFKLFNEHADSIQRSDWSGFSKDLASRFHIFCCEGGPIDLDVFAMMTYGGYANLVWSISFQNVLETVAQYRLA